MTAAADRQPTIAATGVPMCSLSACPQHDGKRCRETGNEPGDVCIPAVMAMHDEIVLRTAQRSLPMGGGDP